MTKRRLLYVMDGREHRSPWFVNGIRAKRAADITRSKHPGCRLCIWVD